MRDERGITLIELLIVMALLAVLILISSYSFPLIFKQSRRESQIVQSQIEGILGLEIMKQTIQHAGFGLPACFAGSITYEEAASFPQNRFNDAPSGIPRPIQSGNNVSFDGYALGSDYLVVRGTLASENSASRAWGYVTKDMRRVFETPKEEKLQSGHRVIVLRPKVDEKRTRELLISSEGFFAVYPNLQNFLPTFQAETYLVYGVDPDTELRMPFNRADFYVRRPREMPSYCAPGTGILYKATINQADGRVTEMPLIECVADMQVTFGVDMNGDGLAETELEDLSVLAASQIREMVRLVRVYVLTHEGGMDRGYRHGTRLIRVGEGNYGRELDLEEAFGPDWRYYRWKLYRMVAETTNLR